MDTSPTACTSADTSAANRSQQQPRTLITGASSGIGAALAFELAARGHRLALLARRKDALEAVAQKTANSDEVIIEAVDVSDPQAVTAAIERVIAAFNGIDCVVLNAGIGGACPVTNFDANIADRVITVNLTANAHIIGAVLPTLLAQESGHIVGIASLASYRGMPARSPYCASKAGFVSLLEGLRPELRPHNVAVTIVNPGFVRTPLTDRNDFAMPFMITADAAAQRIANAMQRRKRRVAFPWSHVVGAATLRALPDWLYDFIAQRWLNKP